MLTSLRKTASAALVCLMTLSGVARADDRSYTEGPVSRLEAIRTEYGRFEEYLQFLDTSWKPQQEAAKRAGYILSYKVLTVAPRTESDPDVYLMVTYKNWEALDHGAEREEAIVKQFVGSMKAADQGAVERSKMRRWLGEMLVQELNLK